MTRSRPSSAATPGRRECGTWPGRSLRCAPRRRRAEGHGPEEHENEEPRRGRREQRDEEGQGEHDEQEGNEAPFEVTPETVVEMLGAPAHADARSIWNGRSCSRFVHSKRNIDEPGNGQRQTAGEEGGTTMTLQQAQRTPGYYGRLIEPWTPESNEPLLFRMVEVLTDGSIMEETMGDPLPLCPSSDLHDDWQPMEASLMLCGPAGFLTSVFILAGVPIHKAMYRAVEMLKRADTSVS